MQGEKLPDTKNVGFATPLKLKQKPVPPYCSSVTDGSGHMKFGLLHRL
jgi:hypothetical protein